MAILKCQHCNYSKEIPSQYAEKTVKCPSCGQSTKVHDTIVLFTALSEKLSEFQTELQELRQVSNENQAKPSQELNDELVQALGKIFRDHRIAMTEFNDATKKRDVMTQRTDRHIQSLFRFGIFGLLTIIIVLSLFLFWFANDFKSISEQLLSVNDGAKVINHNLSSMKVDLAKLNLTVQAINTQAYGEITTSVAAASQNVAKMQASLEDIRISMNKMQDKVKGITDNLSFLTERVEEFTERESNSFRYRSYRQ